MVALSQILAQLYTMTLLFFTILVLELVILLRSISGDRPITTTQYLKLIEEKIPATRYDAAVEPPLECTVCLSTFEEGEAIRKLKCKHVFHKDCLDTWLEQCSATCPLCRSKLLPEEVVLRYRQRRNPPEYEGSDEELIYLLSALHGNYLRRFM
ncbi:PREDICTED: RING-H2 finger protein ATL57-like [Ipomoea nil]|uniref:RING-H2 finger protein ATL57-like n=1 Tax=Ipomoea nil TaxID=35883 RepID=UPI0009011755|nr:PREDICTED: RING-H2 finger protein ATL57-like [Ipomoea nil]